jgi:HAD superfamily hydrolase (TIGR01549 family)
MVDLEKYQTIIFDCDGVILNSNFQKIEAYRKAAISFGANEQQAQALVNHHVALTGISRHIKFKYFLTEIMHQAVTEDAMSQLLKALNEQVLNLLSECEIAKGLSTLRQKTKNSKWMVASGGDEKELNHLFKEKRINHFFDEVIYGGPASKHEIIEIQQNKLNFLPALFLGDSLYDIQTAQKYNLDFVFVSGWTDLSEWEKICEEGGIKTIEQISDLI